MIPKSVRRIHSRALALDIIGYIPIGIALITKNLSPMDRYKNKY